MVFGHGRDYATAFINIDLVSVGNWAERNNIDLRDLHFRNRGSGAVTLSVNRSALGDSNPGDLSYGRRTGFFR